MINFVKLKKEKTFDFDPEARELTPQLELFCMEYVRNKFNAYKAAISAGYAKGTALARTKRMLEMPAVKRKITELKNDIAFAVGVDAIRIAEEYVSIAFFDIAKIYNKDGTLKPVHKIDKKTRAALVGLKTFEVLGPDGVLLGTNKEVKIADKIAALEKYARMIGKDGVSKQEIMLTKIGKDLADESYI